MWGELVYLGAWWGFPSETTAVNSMKGKAFLYQQYWIYVLERPVFSDFLPIGNLYQCSFQVMITVFKA